MHAPPEKHFEITERGISSQVNSVPRVLINFLCPNHWFDHTITNLDVKQTGLPLMPQIDENYNQELVQLYHEVSFQRVNNFQSSERIQFRELFTFSLKFTASPMKWFGYYDVMTQWDCPRGQACTAADFLLVYSYQWYYLRRLSI